MTEPSIPDDLVLLTASLAEDPDELLPFEDFPNGSVGDDEDAGDEPG